MSSRFVSSAFSELRDANRSPIYGYQHLQVTSLEQAIENIKLIVPGLEEYIHLAKNHCNRTSVLLTWDESAAIYLYSMPIGFFGCLNEYLRAENRDALKPWFAYLKLFITGLEKLPSCSIIAWRGVAGDVGSGFSDNDMQIWWSVNSCSKAINVVECYLGETGSIFAIDTTNAKDITTFSAFPQEQEVILMPGSRFRVKANSLNFRNSLFIVHLEEEEEASSVNNPQVSSDHRNKRSTNTRASQNKLSQYIDHSNRRADRRSNIHVGSQQTAHNYQLQETKHAEASSATSSADKNKISCIEEPSVAFHVEPHSINLRSVTQKPLMARSLPKEMNYGISKVMSSNNEFLLLFADHDFYLFNDNLKQIKSPVNSAIYSHDLMDIVWCETLQKFITLTTDQVYLFDPVTTRVSSVENVRLQEEETKFVSCTCSSDKFFVVTSESYSPCYLQVYTLPEFVFLSRLSVTNLIGSEALSEDNWRKTWKTTYQKEDDRQIISIRYNRQRLGILMHIDWDNFLYTLNLAERPIVSRKTKIPCNDSRLLPITHSGEWLVISDEYQEKMIQIALDCQFKTEWESKSDSKDSFFSLSTGFVNLKGSINNAVIFRSSYVVLLLDHSLSMYTL